MSELPPKYEWSTSSFAGQIFLQCLDCAYNVVGDHAPTAMAGHCRRHQHGVIRGNATTIEEYMRLAKIDPIINKKVVLSYLCWNTAEISADGATALYEESKRLDELGMQSQVLVLDNGSKDDTIQVIRDRFHCDYDLVPDNVELLRNRANKGISIARNGMMDYAMHWKSDYVLMMDGDIQVVPLSVYSMMRYLEAQPEVGCFGAYSASWTQNPANASPMLTDIPANRIKSDIWCAWTQYGLFRTEMFKPNSHGPGIRFEESGPFAGPGWGMEDDELYYQMHEQNWGNHYFRGMTYLHRALRSSWTHIEDLGLNVEALFNQRKEFVLAKWQAKGYKNDILNRIRTQYLPNDKAIAAV